MRLSALWGDKASGALWAVGVGGVILRLEAAGWRVVRAPDVMNKDTLRAISGAAPNDVWAGGDRGALLHYDGEQWTVQENDFAHVLAFFGTSKGRVYAVLDKSAERLRLYDGQRWQAVRPELIGYKARLLTAFGTGSTVRVAGESAALLEIRQPR